MSIIETNIASEVAQEPTGPTNTVEIPVQETKIDTIAKAKLQAEALSTFTNKTLVQTADQVYKAPKVKEFVTKITGGKTFEAFDGAYEECKIQLIPAGTNFNKEAFIPSASNVDSKATSIRRDVGNLWKAYRLKMADPDVDGNIYQNRLDYKKSSYKKMLLASGEKFIEESFAQLQASADLFADNSIILGRDVTVDGVADVHMTGYKDLVATCAKDAVSHVNDDGGAKTRNVVYSPATSEKESRIEALVQLNQLLFQMANPNTYFAYGNDGSAANSYITEAAKELVIVGSNQMIEALKGQDVSLFKSLKDIFDTGRIVELPISTFDTSFVSGTDTPLAPLAQLNIGQQNSSLFILDATGWWLKKTEGIDAYDIKDDFINNLTVSHFITEIFTQDYKPNRPVAIFDAQVLVEQYALPVVDVTATTTSPTNKLKKGK